MRVLIDNNDEQTLEANLVSVDYWWQGAVKQISEQNRFIYNVNIDGEVIYSGYEQLIVERINNITEIKIKTISKEESKLETLNSIREYLERFIPVSAEISDYFYGDINEKQWNIFSDYINGLDWIVKSFEFLVRISDDSEVQGCQDILNQLTQLIEQLFVSLENQDFISVGDIIQYEVISVLRKFNTN